MHNDENTVQLFNVQKRWNPVKYLCNDEQMIDKYFHHKQYNGVQV